MKLGIMQPYFFPYIGYWQLINCVDKYIIYDDVNFIKGGWINRNIILINNKPQYINLPLIGSSSNKLINEISVSDNINLLKKLLKSIEFSYKKAPYIKDVYLLLEDIILYEESNLAKWLENSIISICDYLDINTEIIVSSHIDKNNELKSTNKILDICNVLGANEYINAIGGAALYSKDNFISKNIELSFIKTNEIVYKQFNDNMMVSNLSIIDVMIFNSKEDIKKC